MAYEDVNDAPVISLGGKNKETGKANPTLIEGYYIGTRETVDKKKKNGKGYVHEFETQKGTIGVWGKTDLDRKMRRTLLGAMTKVTFLNETKPTPNGDMWLYKVQQDKNNVIEVATPVATPQETAAPAVTSSISDESEDEYGDEIDGEEDAQPDEVQPGRAAPPARRAQAPSPERQATVNRLLANRGKASA